MRKNLLLASLFSVIAVIAGLIIALPTAHAAPGTGAAYPVSTVSVAPTKVIHESLPPDARGGVWSGTIIVWVTSFPVSKPNAQGQVFQDGPALAQSIQNIPYIIPPKGCGTATGYTTKYNYWQYSFLGLRYVWTQLYTQDYWNCPYQHLQNKFVDPQCGSNVPNSSCNSYTSGSHQNVSCDASGVVGICNYDWGDFNVTIAGGNHWDYLRSWADASGDFTTSNDNP